MNVNILAIDSNLAAATEASPSPSKADLNTRSSRFALTLDNEKAQAKIPEKPATDNIKEKDQNNEKSISNSQQELTQSADKKIKSEMDLKQRCDSNLALPSGKNSIGTAQFGCSNSDNKSGQSHGVALTLMDTVHWPEGAEANSGLKLAQINADTQGKSASITGHTLKSTEIKLLHSTEKGQLGIKTILPAKSNGQNGLKVITPELTKNIPVINKQAETAINNEKAAVSAKTIGLSERGNIKESAPITSVNSGKSTDAPGVKPSAMNLNLTTVQDKKVEPEKLKLTAETDSETKKSQSNSNLSNPNSKQSTPAGNDISGYNVQKLNAASVQVTAGQTKDQSNSASNKSSSQGFEQMLSHNNSQTLIAEQTSAPAKNAAAANPQSQSSNNTSADIGRQILESVQSSMSRQGTEQQITVRLNPPELGKVLIRFQQQDKELTGLMEVSKTQTRLEIEQALPQIIRNLADCGIQVRRLDVMLSNEQQTGQGPVPSGTGQGAFGNQSLQNGGAQQQYSPNQDTSGNDSVLSRNNDWLSGSNSYENLSELQETLITNGSINLLI
jgi:flagellar hook-length control protein FliK